MDDVLSAGRQKQIATVVERMMGQMEKTLASDGVAGELRYLNDPALVARGHEFYRAMLRFGSGADQPAVALVSAWYRRNLELCARLAQSAKPGDRVLVMYGAGHLALLRRCVQEMPGWKLVEVDKLLP